MPFLLGAEAGFLLAWQVAQDPRWVPHYPGAGPVLPYVLLDIVPLGTVLVALGLGWVGRRPPVIRALVGLTLVGPVLVVACVLLGGARYTPSVMLAGPASIAAAAGLVGGLRWHAGRSYLVLVVGSALGFLVPSFAMLRLGIGHMGDDIELGGNLDGVDDGRGPTGARTDPCVRLWRSAVNAALTATGAQHRSPPERRRGDAGR